MSFISLLIFSLLSFASDYDHTLKKLYPELSTSVIKRKIDQSENEHDFYRSFVRLYYHELKNFSIPKYWLQRGVIVGDAHVENFGFILNHKNHITFNYNDFDDTSLGYPFLDLMRFMTSAKLALPTMNLDSLIDYYILGLDDYELPEPKIFKKLYHESLQKGQSLPKSVDIEKMLIKKKKEIAHALSAEEKNDILEALNKHFNTEIILLDGYRRDKLKGGSAGFNRYELLIKHEETLRYLHLKQEVTPAPHFYALPEITFDKMKIIKHHVLADHYDDKDIFILKIKDQSFSTRYEISGNIGVELSELSHEDKEKMILVEAQALGKIHGRNMKEINLYKKKLKHKKESAKKLSQEITELFIKIFNQFKNQRSSVFLEKESRP